MTQRNRKEILKPITLPVDMFNRESVFTGRRWLKKKAHDILKRLFWLPLPGAWFSKIYRRGVWDGKIKMLDNRGGISTGLLLASEGRLKKAGILLRISDYREPPKFREIPRLKGSVVLKDLQYQKDAVLSMIRGSATGGLILNATGTGKTVIAAMFLSQLKGSACFVVDQLNLLDQARESFEKILGEKIGMVGDSVFKVERITVATIQTLAKHRTKAAYKKWFGTLRVVLLDELHDLLGKRSNAILDSIQPKTVYGFTATLGLDNPLIAAKAYRLCGPVLFRYPYARAVADGHLAPGVCLQVRLDPRNMGEAIEAGKDPYTTFTVGSKRFNKTLEELTRACVADGRAVLLLVDRVKHLKKLSERLSDIPHALLYGAVNRTKRNTAKKDFLAGKIDLIISNRVLKKGADIPRINCVIDGACLGNKNDCLQKFGRATRLLQGKNGFLYFDVGYEMSPDYGSAEEVPPLVRATNSRRTAFRREGIWVTASKSLEPRACLKQAKQLLKDFTS